MLFCRLRALTIPPSIPIIPIVLPSHNPSPLFRSLAIRRASSVVSILSVQPIERRQYPRFKSRIITVFDLHPQQRACRAATDSISQTQQTGPVKPEVVGKHLDMLDVTPIQSHSWDCIGTLRLNKSFFSYTGGMFNK